MGSRSKNRKDDVCPYLRMDCVKDLYCCVGWSPFPYCNPDVIAKGTYMKPVCIVRKTQDEVSRLINKCKKTVEKCHREGCNCP